MLGEKGQGMVEYVLILALVSVLSIGTLVGIGERTTGNYTTVSESLGSVLDSKSEYDKEAEELGLIGVTDGLSIRFYNVEDDAWVLEVIGDTAVKDDSIDVVKQPNNGAFIAW